MKTDLSICNSCASDNLAEFDSEMNIHFSGVRSLDKPSIFAFPKIMICLNCGSLRSTLSAEELRILQKSAARTYRILL
jgi:hypothetical protein